jgi:probable F420-dependent oxidoreductase
MRFGVHVLQASRHTTRQGLFDVARAAEELGYASVWLFDRLFRPTSLGSAYPGTADGSFGFAPEHPNYEAVSLLAALAATTDRVLLGTRVLVPLFRPPVLLAKQLASIDALAGGRVVLGVGTGWMREEFEAVGVPMERRLARLDEHVAVMQRAWARGISSFEGELYRHAEAGFFPQPPRPGNRLPVLLGGIRDAVLRRVAAYGDGWCPFTPPSPGHDTHELIDPALLRERLDTLRRLCDEVGRDAGELRIVVGARFSSSPDVLAEHAKLGVTDCALVSFAPPEVIAERAADFAERVGTEIVS